MRAMSAPAEPSGRDLLEAALRGASPPPPYLQLLNMRFIAVTDGSATFEMPSTSQLYNPNSVVHGGAITSLADLEGMVRYHTHHHHPVGEVLKRELQGYAEDLKKVAVFKPGTDTAKFAERIYVDVFGV